MTTIVGGVDIESTGLDFTSGHKIIEIAITRYELAPCVRIVVTPK